MPKVQFRRDFRSWTKGETHDVNDRTAAVWAEAGIAKALDEPPQDKAVTRRRVTRKAAEPTDTGANDGADDAGGGEGVSWPDRDNA